MFLFLLDTINACDKSLGHESNNLKVDPPPPLTHTHTPCKKNSFECVQSKTDSGTVAEIFTKKLLTDGPRYLEKISTTAPGPIITINFDSRLLRLYRFKLIRVKIQINWCMAQGFIAMVYGISFLKIKEYLKLIFVIDPFVFYQLFHVIGIYFVEFLEKFLLYDTLNSYSSYI
jgi:hypothetical protein